MRSKIVNFVSKVEKYPQIYVYSIEGLYKGCLKVGFTTRKNVKDRIDEQFAIEFPDGKKPYKLEYKTDAIDDNGNVFNDKKVHKLLMNAGYKHLNGEWFECTLDEIKAIILAIKKGVSNIENRTQSFGLRPEQAKAVEVTMNYFNQMVQKSLDIKPHFLWNAKMRFGKTFTSYQLAKSMGWDRILILTYKPAVESSWKEDLNNHIDFEGWQFVSRETLNYESCDQSKPIVCFGSFQDYLGRTDSGEIKPKNQWVHDTMWDCIIFDEYHFGAWRDSAKELVDDDIFDRDYCDVEVRALPIKSNHFLYLSGTPFRAIDTGEFIEEQIFYWTYTDEQRAKENWVGDNNPYASLPKLVLLTYKLPDEISEIAQKGEYNEFDLNEFFKATGEDSEAKFIHQDEVQKWLDLIRGNGTLTTVDKIKLGAEKPPLPFEDVELTKLLSHTLWLLPSVASCYAMANLIAQPQNKSYYGKYKVVVSAGVKAGVGIKAIKPVMDAIGNPFNTQTITLSCGKLTTGVTIKPWTGIFMLSSMKSPESYFQTAFRVQSPWTIIDEDKETIIKHQCYIFDFAPNRALEQIATYCDKTNQENISPEAKVEEFIRFLPILAYDGFAMEQVDASGLLDIAMGRTTATLLAKGWNNALLVNVDNDTLKSLIADESAMLALEQIESFRNTSDDINIIISNTEEIEKLKTKEGKEPLSKGEKVKKDELEKSRDSRRKEIQRKLKALATRIPLFIYLSDDYREATLENIIYPLEPELFKRVTGITHQDFEKLKDIGLFNSNLMNHAVYNFRKYEEPSLMYTGINKHIGEDVGGFDMTMSEEEFKTLKP